MTRPGDPFDPAKPGGLAAELAEIRRRLRRLEFVNRLVAASAVDDEGTTRIRFGIIPDPDDGTLTDYGLQISAADVNADGIGGVVFQAGDQGIVFPLTNIGGWGNWNETPTSVTSATFIRTYYQRIRGWVGGQIAFTGTVQSDAGTTGELRVHEFFSGETTNTVTIPSGANKKYECAWDLPSTIASDWWGTPSAGHDAFFEVQVRRTGGTGNVYVFTPENFNVGGATWVEGRPSATAVEIT